MKTRHPSRRGVPSFGVCQGLRLLNAAANVARIGCSTISNLCPLRCQTPLGQANRHRHSSNPQKCAIEIDGGSIATSRKRTSFAKRWPNGCPRGSVNFEHESFLHEFARI